VSEIVPFCYPGPEVARYCEERVAAIRQLMVKTVRTVAAIGALLAEVEGMLPPGLFPRWVEHHFGWSQESARRYKLLARAVDDNPRILELKSIELAIRFPALPERTQQAILDANAFRLKDAQLIIQRHKADDWRLEVERLVETDPGRAHREIELAMGDPDLREAACEMMDKHIETFALLSSREPAEIKAEAGMTRQERLGKAAFGRPSAQLTESRDGCTLVIWAEAPHTVAIFPPMENPVARSWQAKIIDRVVEITDAKTLDGIAGEIL
jgi:hypothetical protein